MAGRGEKRVTVVIVVAKIVDSSVLDWDGTSLKLLYLARSSCR